VCHFLPRRGREFAAISDAVHTIRHEARQKHRQFSMAALPHQRESILPHWQTTAEP
jgi:hypothetical protein